MRGRRAGVVRVRAARGAGGGGSFGRLPTPRREPCQPRARSEFDPEGSSPRFDPEGDCIVLHTVL